MPMYPTLKSDAQAVCGSEVLLTGMATTVVARTMGSIIAPMLRRAILILTRKRFKDVADRHGRLLMHLNSMSLTIE